MTALLAALLLATVGTTALVEYVQSARNKVLAAESVVPVLVATAPVPKGVALTAATAAMKKVPSRLVAPGALTATSAVAGLVAKQDIAAGEQITQSMMQTPSEATSTDPPPGKLLVTIQLNPEQTVGGRLQPGDTVAMFASFAPPGGGAGGAAAGGGNETHLVLHHLQIAALEGAAVPRTAQGAPATAAPTKAVSGAAAAAPAAQAAPSGSLLITLALSPKDAETVIYASHYATVTLALESSSAPTNPIPPANAGSLQ